MSANTANAEAAPAEGAAAGEQQVTPPHPAGPGYHSASLYVGDLHPDVTEALLFDIFNAVGPVASIRVCRDAVTRRSLGYAYVNFHHMTDAERALDTMNYTLIKDRPCRMMWSQRDPSLRKTGAGNVFVKNLDLSIDNKALADTFSLFGNILSCKVVTDREGNSLGHGFVHFETLEAAEDAIKKINGMMIAGKEVFVGKFQKRTERAGANDWTNIYVKNLPKHWSDKRVEEVFGACGPIASSVIMKDAEGKSKGFGFVDFEDHDSAAASIELLNKKEFPIDEESEKMPADEEEDKKEGDDKKEDGGKEEDSAAGNTDEKKSKRRMIALFVSRAQKKSERDRELSEKFEQMKMERHSKYQGVNLYVKNLDEKVTDEVLHKEFAIFGSITSVRVMREAPEPVNEDEEPVEEGSEEAEARALRKLGVSKGFGFVCFSSAEEAMRAVTEMQGRMVLGKPIFVALAQRKENRRAHLEAQHTRTRGRGMPMQPGMYPGQPVYMGGVPGAMPGGMPGVMPPQARGNYGYMPGIQMMMPRGVPGRGMPGYPGQPGMPPGGAGGFPQGHPVQMQPQPMGVQMQQPRGQPGRGGRGGARGGRGGRGAGKPEEQGAGFKYNANVRNQPGAQQHPAQMGGQQMPMHQAHHMQPMQPEPLTAAALASASEQEQKNMIGERLYPLIHKDQPELAGKITGMLLEMDNPELLHLLESPDALNSKIQEAIQVLQQHAHSG
uniref:PABP n=1 Tax=Mucochytrium quahogii TaxID=96639 RepID=A0A7S2SAR9_9STRA|mmetsp:Transcript_13351/g.21822  ORF Transcript_13351/g.21822 Transcript_13351/m.21822 type:complete len:723 (+) Transcript_13351:113-2281(+)|eukprot:CAMPEP_0203764724 /NCGR_PEP_ID=MMETSP0098-20131031/17995_1 /ASSEMBLY_ACC=CAM_ASM_000208 /TAXON_ID=96639 /ORGANISM=" , Strain NY0313808BC1" /LENGTH=722 /DNA_ID=CAMNT_0050660877 /DNA_START=141 /DNA_END=2309 /DNA_ORIENTATION=+